MKSAPRAASQREGSAKFEVKGEWKVKLRGLAVDASSSHACALQVVAFDADVGVGSERQHA